MKTKILLMLVLLGMTMFCYAQSAEEGKVEEAVENLRVAMVDGDDAKLTSLASEILSYGHSSGVIEDKATFVKSIANGKNDFKSIEQSNQTIAIKDNVALVRHKFTAEVLINGNSTLANIGVLQVWQKESSGWKLIARQAFKL